MSLQRSGITTTVPSKMTLEGDGGSEQDQMNTTAGNAVVANKSPTSSLGKQGKSSQREAIAKLDLFLTDISLVTEKVKKEEEKKMQSCNTRSALTEENLKLHGEISSSSDPPRRWNSLQSIGCDDAQHEAPSSQRHISYDDIPALADDVSTTEPSDAALQQVRKINSAKGPTYSVASISSQGSDSAAQSYGLQHLNQLCNILEQFEQLKQQNTALSKRVSNYETIERQAHSSKDAATGNAKSTQRHSASFLAPSNKPPKRVKPKPSKAKYLSTLFFTSAAKSVENLRSSAQNLDKIKPKIFSRKPMHNYAVDDMELRKSPGTEDMSWRNSSVKESSRRQDLSSLDYIDPAEITFDCTDGFMSSGPDIIVSDGLLSFNTQSEEAHSLCESSTNQAHEIAATQSSVVATYPKLKKDEQEYRNTKKMTEWAVLQQVFPVTQVDSNLSLLRHLDSILGKDQKKSNYLPVLKLGSSRQKSVPGPKKNAKMFLPPAETSTSTLAFHAAHAMTSQLTLTMSSSEIEMLSNHMKTDLPVPPKIHPIPPPSISIT